MNAEAARQKFIAGVDSALGQFGSHLWMTADQRHFLQALQQSAAKDLATPFFADAAGVMVSLSESHTKEKTMAIGFDLGALQKLIGDVVAAAPELAPIFTRLFNDVLNVVKAKQAGPGGKKCCDEGVCRHCHEALGAQVAALTAMIKLHACCEHAATPDDAPDAPGGE